uniref:nck-associated protein 5-like isoform X2 n=1 Tax=Doryrhamphus excisus TaxID=161450 RepID=UPI0025ADB6AC|nr:nck-associated protein 5-like isoform X2 [Doryrhamphus excisus]
MSHFADPAPRIRSVPLLELQAEYMDANRCIDELLKQLEEERRNLRREKLALARLQREVARTKSEGTMREKLIHELEEERRLRLESEKRLREVTEESELGRAQIVCLQQQFSRMEETVRSLLQNQGIVEPTAADTADIMKAYKEKLSEEVHKQHDCPEKTSPLPATQTGQESVMPLQADASQTDEDDGRTKLLLERLKALEERNSVLASENESQREQYERCLDEVANQVVQALVTQKDLREECLKLRTRVFDLEQQNRALGFLFQQRIKPASDLLLQKLHSRIMDLSAADLLQEPERSKAFLLARNTDSPSTEIQMNGKSGLPITKCLSQLSLTAQAPAYPRSSCSSSELSLSSACSELSSGSYTWNDGRSCGKASSLTWEKRRSLGSSAPSNVSGLVEEQMPTRRKETNILEGLRKLQRRKHKSSSSSRVSKSGYKDCMNSNEGIYSLGIKKGKKGLSKPTHTGRASAFVGKKFLYDSDDADDELAQSGHVDDVPTKDSWLYCTRLSHSISDSLSSWEGFQEIGGGGDSSSGLAATKPPTAMDSKERPEKLMSFINSCLSEAGRPSAFTRVSTLHVTPSKPDTSNCLSDMDDLEELSCDSRDLWTPLSQQVEQKERISRDSAKLFIPQRLHRDQGRTQSADGRPEPVSLIKEAKAAKSMSEESILAVFDAQGQPIELSPQKLDKSAMPEIGVPLGKVVAEYNGLAPQEMPTRQKPSNPGNYTVVEPSECEIRTSKTNSRGGNTERLSMQLTPQKKLIKPPGGRASKGHSIPPFHESTSTKSGGVKLPGYNKPYSSPIRLSKGTTTEPSNSGNSGSPGQEKTPPPPTTKMSRFMKSSQSPKVANSKLQSRAEWSKGSSPSSPKLSRRHVQYADNGEQPTRDKHCESIKNKLRSPSPPLPPGRTTSLLIKPNYDGSPQAHKIGVAQPSIPTTVRGPPPSYHTSLQPNMQATLPIKDKECLDTDAGYGTALAPQKLVDKTSQHLQKSPAETPSTGTPKRTMTKDYLPPANSGLDLDSENAPKNSRNVPPPYGALRGPHLHNSFVSKRGSSHESDYQSVQKPQVHLAVPVKEAPQSKTELQNAKNVASPPNSVTTSPNSAENSQKTRIPMGFKAFLKSPPTHKNSPSLPAKQEKDHINLVSKENVAANASSQCDILQPSYSIDSPPKMSLPEGKSEVHCRSLEGEINPILTAEEEDVCDKGKRNSQLFSRSISVSTKTHLKPALGMNGAKARSQSFSTNCTEKPHINVLEGPGKIRTQIITNSTERGNSLSRQASLEAPSVAGLAESPVRSPRARLSYYGGMTGVNNLDGLPEKTSKLSFKYDGHQSTVEGETVTPHKEAHGFPTSEKTGLNHQSVNICKSGKVTSQFQSPASCPYGSENRVRNAGVTASSPNEPEFSSEVKTQSDSPNKPPDMEEKRISPSACTIEEKVMMGIEENLHKCQEQQKVAASESKQKTGPSLANWFGFRKSKLPAMTGKKAESPKGKDERKELKIGSVLAGKQTRVDKKKEKKKNESQEAQKQSEMNNKLSSIMDHCNNQMGQIATQIQCTTAFIGKDQFVKELLGRAAGKSNSVVGSPTGISSPRKHTETKGNMKICPDAATLLISEKSNLRGDNKEGRMADNGCQDHVMGTGCQMRTLDSGIGTFPLPDSVTRASGRHIPKSESSPDGVTAQFQAESSSPHTDPSQSSVKVPSLPKSPLHAPASLSHSLSDPSVTYGGDASDAQTRLPQPSRASRTKRLSLFTPQSSILSSTEAIEDETGRKNDGPAERALLVCNMYSGSSSGSDTETELERPRSTLSPLQRPRINRCQTNDAAAEKTLRRGSMDSSLSIMHFYQQEMFSHLAENSNRICDYNLLCKDTPLPAGDILSMEVSLEKTVVGANKPGSLEDAMESLSNLSRSSIRKEAAADGGRPDAVVCEPSSSKARADPTGSLSDSLYDSFSSCTSQGSNDV